MSTSGRVSLDQTQTEAPSRVPTLLDRALAKLNELLITEADFDECLATADRLFEEKNYASAIHHYKKCYRFYGPDTRQPIVDKLDIIIAHAKQDPTLSLEANQLRAAIVVPVLSHKVSSTQVDRPDTAFLKTWLAHLALQNRPEYKSEMREKKHSGHSLNDVQPRSLVSLRDALNQQEPSSFPQIEFDYIKAATLMGLIRLNRRLDKGKFNLVDNPIRQSLYMLHKLAEQKNELAFNTLSKIANEGAYIRRIIASEKILRLTEDKDALGVVTVEKLHKQREAISNLYGRRFENAAFQFHDLAEMYYAEASKAGEERKTYLYNCIYETYLFAADTFRLHGTDFFRSAVDRYCFAFNYTTFTNDEIIILELLRQLRDLQVPSSAHFHYISKKLDALYDVVINTLTPSDPSNVVLSPAKRIHLIDCLIEAAKSFQNKNNKDIAVRYYQKAEALAKQVLTGNHSNSEEMEFKLAYEEAREGIKQCIVPDRDEKDDKHVTAVNELKHQTTQLMRKLDAKTLIMKIEFNASGCEITTQIGNEKRLLILNAHITAQLIKLGWFVKLIKQLGIDLPISEIKTMTPAVFRITKESPSYNLLASLFKQNEIDVPRLPAPASVAAVAALLPPAATPLLANSLMRPDFRRTQQQSTSSENMNCLRFCTLL